MAETILNWICTQLEFPNKINIEEEFSNGYYFGKLFEINNLFDNMKELKNTNDKEDSIKNYSLLKPVFREIDIKISDYDINELIDKKKHKAELFLYSIKQKISLKSFQFNDILQKIKHETNSTNNSNNNNITDKSKRNKSARQTFYSQNLNTFSNFKTNYQTKDKLILNNDTKERNINSARNVLGKTKYINHKSRLNSAKLPNLNNIQTNEKKRREFYENKKKNKEEELAEEKQIQSVLNEIKIFENIHMKKNKKKLNINTRNPWDKGNYIYNNYNNNILEYNDKGKNEESKNKLTILDLKDSENRKDYNTISIASNNNISKLHSNINKFHHNQFKINNKRKYINKKNFEQGLFRMGLVTNNLLPSIAKIKDKNIPSEIVLKSINETLKNKKLKLKELNNISASSINNKDDATSSNKNKNKKVKSKSLNKTNSSLKRPLSSVNSYNNKTQKDISKLNSGSENKTITSNKRPLTAKILKQNIKIEENKDKINNIKQKSEKLIENVNNTNGKINKKIEKRLSQIPETDLKGEVEEENLNNEENVNSSEEDENFNEEKFFKKLNKEKIDSKSNDIKKILKRKSENILNKKYIRNMVFSIIDMTEFYYDYQNEKDLELIDIDKWHEIKYKFIYNKPIIKRKKKKRALTEEEIGNYDFDVFAPIDEEYSQNYGIYEIDEMKNFLNQRGNYDRNKNNLFFKKLNLKEVNIEINDVMGEEIQLLYNKAKAEGNDVEEEDEEQFKKTGIKKYHPSKDEEEILEQWKTFITEYNFTNLISEIIEFEYKDSQEKLKKGIFGEIEEPKNKNISENKNSEDDQDKNVLIKELLKSIPVKISFIGLLNNEIKTTINSSINKYPKMKIYNPIEFLKDLRQKKKKIDENIDEKSLKKYQIEQLKKEKINLKEEIKEYMDIIENKDNLTDNEICIKILQKKIMEDFEMKNIENIKQEIANRREQIKNLTSELNRVKEEQQKKHKTNLRELQVYQQQLDKIEIESMIGFIIINFPNNLEQSKLIEEKMFGFIPPCEQSKSYLEELNDKLLFLCDKEQKDNKFTKFNSFLEKIVYFYCDNSKLFPEKIIPQNPVPTSGKGGHQPIIVTDEFTKNEVEDYINNYKILEEFYQNFNIQIDKYDYYEGIIEENINNNKNNQNKNAINNNFMIRDKVITEKLRNTLNIYEEKIVPKPNISMLMEESCEDGLDDLSQIKDKDSNIKISGESSFKQANDNNSKQQIKNQLKDSNNSSSLKKEMSKMPSINNNIANNNNVANANDKIIVQKGASPENKPIALSISQINDEEKLNIYKMWYNFNKQYNYYCFRLFYRERTVKRKTTEETLDEAQKNFIKFLSNSADTKIIINQFIQKYKTFRDNYCKTNTLNSASNSIIVNNYKKDLSELNETLWNISKIRKNLAFEEIEKLEKDIHIKTDLIFCYFKMERLIILETQKLIVIINIFIRYYNLIFNSKLASNKTQPQITLDISLSKEILKDLDKEELAIQKNDKKIIYPRANRLYKNCFRALIKIYIYLDNFYSSIPIKKINLNSSTYKSMKTKKLKRTVSGKQNAFSSMMSLNPNIKYDLSVQIKNEIKIHIKKYKYNMYNLYLNTLENLSKIYCPFKQVLKLMDNWIILSMELQNKKIKETINYFDLINNFKNDNNINNININNNSNKLNNKIEKKIVDLIIKEDNEMYNFEYTGINIEEFKLFDLNKYIGISDSTKMKSQTDNDYLKLFDIFKEFDILTKLRNNEIQKGIITKSKFEELFFKDFLFDNFEKFPKEFINIDFHNISIFLSHFIILSSELNDRKNINDNNNNEFNGKPQELIYTNDIITILLLSCIPFDFNQKKQNKNCTEIYINKEKFMKINFGFENEISKIYDKNKTKDLKLYLFNIHKNSNEIPEINIKKFINLLSLKSIKNELKKEINKYFDLFYY